MPSVTFDGRSFMLDGRRVWLVSGSIPYAKIPHEHWADRIHAAKVAGLNTVETPVYWNRHEPRPGQFDFTGDNDLRRFVQLVGDAGLYCILRPGPFIGGDWDFGGLPSWLMTVANVQFRTANGPFLEACSRYVMALADQVRDLQVTGPGRGGPIILVQNEFGWTCGHAKLAHTYLGELNRYLREAGLVVPTINANNLWQGVEGEIDCWSGSDPMAAIMRQLAAVRPTQPRVVINLEVGPMPTWGTLAGTTPTPASLVRRLAEVLAGGGQFNIHPFAGGTNFAFWGGRTIDSAASFAATRSDPGSPLSDVGSPGASYSAVRRLCTFASRFGRLFSNLDPSYQPVALDPGAAEGGGVSVLHAIGAQGGVAFLFAQPPQKAGEAPTRTRLLLSNGATLPVEVGPDGVAWCLFNVTLAGRATLDYSSLSAFGVIGRVLICFGHPGAPGRLAINGSVLDVVVPESGDPLVREHESVVVVVCNTEQLERVHFTDSGVYLGVERVRADGTPVAPDGADHVTFVESGGTVKTTRLPRRDPRPRAATKIPTTPWAVAGMEDHTRGSSARYAAIDGPTELVRLGAPMGYGWYRITLKGATTHKVRAVFPDSADRLHVFADGEFVGLHGEGPGASPEVSLPLRKGEHCLVVLADNLGRAAGGADLGERKGLFGHAWEASPMRVGKPSIRSGAPVDVMSFRAPLWEVSEGDATLADRITWSIQHRRKTPIFVTFGPMRGRGLVFVNDKPVLFLGRSVRRRLALWPDDLGRGVVLLQIALLPEPVGAGEPYSADDAAAEVGAGTRFYEGEGSITAKAEWAFARWEPPAPSAFVTPEKPGPHAGPAWWRCEFTPPPGAVPLVLELDGMTKGQIYVNGRNLGRYFVACRDGTRVPPQSSYLIPESWVQPGQPNDLLLFDEHGGNPAKCRITPEGSAGAIIRA